MAIVCRPWVDIVVYCKGINVERVHFNETYLTSTLVPKLIYFHENYVAPDIVSPVHALG